MRCIVETVTKKKNDSTHPAEEQKSTKNTEEAHVKTETKLCYILCSQGYLDSVRQHCRNQDDLQISVSTTASTPGTTFHSFFVDKRLTFFF